MNPIHRQFEDQVVKFPRTAATYKVLSTGQIIRWPAKEPRGKAAVKRHRRERQQHRREGVV